MPHNHTHNSWSVGKAHPELVTLGDPRLRKKTREIKNLSIIFPLCQKMITIVRAINGAGLAAPQIGQSLRLFVVEVRKTKLFPSRPESPAYTIINPKLSKASDKVIADIEGCFSVPGYVGMVPRFAKVRLQYLTLDGKKHNDIISGYLARVMQHEYDHLEGKVYLDRMTHLDKFWTVENWQKHHLR